LRVIWIHGMIIPLCIKRFSADFQLPEQSRARPE
jgi:hypothetical protein